MDRQRPRERARRNASIVGFRFGRELRLARATAGLRQRDAAVRAGVSQSLVSQVERGLVDPSLSTMAVLAASVGHDIVVRLLPADGVRLRDSRQMSAASRIVGVLHSTWRRSLEVPVGQPPDRRAADLVLTQEAEIVMVEIETRLVDFQAQYRAAQLKRSSYSRLLGKPVGLVLALVDTESNRRVTQAYEPLIREASPVSSRAAWRALRAGDPIGGDALLWVRVPPGLPAPSRGTLR